MIKITKNLSEAQYVTHAGNFHADDVFSTVFLEKMYKDIRVKRVNWLMILVRENLTIIKQDMIRKEKMVFIIVVLVFFGKNLGYLI